MPRDFGISTFMTTNFGKGHQSPEWEAWSRAKNDHNIATLRIENDMETDEKGNKNWTPPGQIIQMARAHGLNISAQEAKELADLHKGRYDRKAVVPWGVKRKLQLASSPGAGGTVTPPEGDYDGGTVITLTATPNPLYTFDKWTGDAQGEQNPIIVWLKGKNYNITAHFKHV